MTADPLGLVLDHARDHQLKVNGRQEKLLRAPSSAVDLAKTRSLAEQLRGLVAAMLDLSAPGEVEEAVVAAVGDGTVFAELVHEVLAAAPPPAPEPAPEPAREPAPEPATTDAPDGSVAAAPDPAPAAPADVPADGHPPAPVATPVAPTPEERWVPSTPALHPAPLGGSGRSLLDMLTASGSVTDADGPLQLQRRRGVQVAPAAQLKPVAAPPKRFGRRRR